MKLFVVKHWCDFEILGVFDTEEKALECVNKYKPKKSDPSWLREEYDIFSFILNSEDSEEIVYNSRDLRK